MGASIRPESKRAQKSKVKKAMSDWSRYLEKQARVFGERQPDSIDEAAIPYEYRKAQFMDYAKRKAEEGATPLGKAVGVGGLTGGALGGLLGAASGRPRFKSGLIGLGGGALLGGGLGALTGLSDAAEVDQMKLLTERPESSDRELANRIVAARESKDRERNKRFRNELRRMKTASVSDLIPGGKADKKPLSDFPPKQIAMGQKVEMEHTNDPAKAREISRDHLEEFSDYYTRLKKMEEEAKKAKSKTAGMPFLEQDRPAKVKEIYSALKRDHPNMPAEMKARIAARQGKRGKQKQGPPYKGPITSKYKAASLDRSLGVLYSAYGPPKTKHAAANYFFYEVNRGERDVEALGAPFCKLASQSGMDPWDMALGVVRQFDVLEKAASRRGPEGDLARFYMAWADEMEKKAVVGKALSMAGAGVRQLGRNIRGMSSSGRMSQAVQDVGRGVNTKPRGVLSAMSREGKNYDKVKAWGGGSHSRGKQLVQQDLAAGRAGRAPAAGGGRTTAPPTQPPGAQEGFTRGQYLLGGGVLAGAAGLGGMGIYGGGQPQPQYQGGY